MCNKQKYEKLMLAKFAGKIVFPYEKILLQFSAQYFCLNVQCSIRIFFYFFFEKKGGKINECTWIKRIFVNTSKVPEIFLTFLRRSLN